MYQIIYITAKDKVEAEKIVQALLKQRLIACANIIEGVASHFWWEGKVDRSEETLIICKSRRDKFSLITASVKAHHSYDVPEVIACSITEGNADYLRWIDDSLDGK